MVNRKKSSCLLVVLYVQILQKHIKTILLFIYASVRRKLYNWLHCKIGSYDKVGRMKTAAVVSYKTIRRAGPADPTGHSVAALLTQILFEADPRDPLALNFWVGSVTRRADPAHSHPEFWTFVGRSRPNVLKGSGTRVRLPMAHYSDNMWTHKQTPCP